MILFTLGYQKEIGCMYESAKIKASTVKEAKEKLIKILGIAPIDIFVEEINEE